MWSIDGFSSINVSLLVIFFLKNSVELVNIQIKFGEGCAFSVEHTRLSNLFKTTSIDSFLFNLGNFGFSNNIIKIITSL